MPVCVVTHELMNIQGVHKKTPGFVICQYLHEIFTKFKKESQFCNLLVLSFSKLTLLLIFRQVEAEKIEVKETRGHSYFSH